MLTTYFTRQTTRATYYASPAGPYLDTFTDWLTQRGYRQETIRRRLQGVTQFVTWVQTTEGGLQACSSTTLERFRQYLFRRGQLLRSRQQHSVRWLGAQLFWEFLQAQQLVPPISPAQEVEHPALVREFEHWMHQHRGVTRQTLDNYRPHILALLTELGTCPEQFDATQLRIFFLAYARHRSVALAKIRGNALRMFLRFLIAQGRCQTGLDAAIPPIAHWPLATLPRYLPPEDVERVIATCDGTSARAARDRAILLLLARLGLRAGEVAGLQFSAIDWTQGTFRVMGKTRREEQLPLPQEVGDAILHYVDTARPAVNSTSIFLTAIAPWTPLSRYGVTGVAAQALRRAGVQTPSYGAHVLRHSAATGLLRQGASLQVIGEVLRHRSVDTTAHYAKVDVGLLQYVVQPWPGGTAC